ncbi:fe2+ zn2+ uptake regulation protein [Pseudomonas sp. ANT_J28]|uniref:fe2+ zn2+ uptake regulation protein n=1 Tax=Pseudomonas sp. ANT_J28 TaxID=2597352 RepID=UPI0011F0C095|nr:fe2+ zn2+ uptake regulation protein [Pseudomonas sp. ANT_J28]KAA0983902.1 fe2+ zn2+ uptake regulation protein [Pseudomonas sp. ANT_J28]
MYNHSASAPPVTQLQFQAAATQRASESDRGTNKHIRELLRYYGLRTSLIRLKVIDALLIAARDGRSINARDVHAYLESFAAELSFICVREVLKRLCDEGVILFQSDKRYIFTTQACAILEQHSDC